MSEQLSHYTPEVSVERYVNVSRTVPKGEAPRIESDWKVLGADSKYVYVTKPAEDGSGDYDKPVPRASFDQLNPGYWDDDISTNGRLGDTLPRPLKAPERQGEVVGDIAERFQRDVSDVAVSVVVELAPQQSEMQNETDDSITLEQRAEWNIPEQASHDELSEALNKQITELDDLKAAVLRMKQLGEDINTAARRAMSGYGNIDVQSVLQLGSQLQALRRQTDLFNPSSAIGSVNDRSAMGRMKGDIDSATRNVYAAEQQLSEQSSISMLLRVTDSLSQMPGTLARVQQSMDAIRQQLNVNAQEVVQSNEVTFANAEVSRIAKELQERSDISEHELSLFDQRLQRILDAMIIIDMNAFGDRVVKDSEKSRNAKGRDSEGGNPTSRRYVSELAVDMLRGNFQVDQGNDAILVGRDGSILLGQHRAAALRLLYGNQWTENASQYGIKIEKKY